MTEELAETPYLVIWTKGNVNDKNVKLYYLGKGGYDKLKDAASVTALKNLQDELYYLKQRVWVLETPQRQQAVIDFCDRPREEHSIERHTKATFSDLQELVSKGKLYQFKHKSVTMYSLTELDVPWKAPVQDTAKPQEEAKTE